MYRHLFVPIDGSALSTDSVDRAVEFASEVGACVTFFYASPSFSHFVVSEREHNDAITSQEYAEQSAKHAHEILSKAEAVARTAGVVHSSFNKTSDAPYQAIIELARERGCDLIFMASSVQHGTKGSIGSQALKVLMDSEIPVLLGTTRSGVPTLHKAISIIQDEHRSLSVVINGLRFVLARAITNDIPPNFDLLHSMIHYIEVYPETLHHPKEEIYLFRRLHERTDEADQVILSLQRQHFEGRQLVREMQHGLTAYMSAAQDGLAIFSTAVERFAKAQTEHMYLEEKVIIPAARKYFTAQDWQDIAEAFEQNDAPHFDAGLDEDFHTLFTKMLSLNIVA